MDSETIASYGMINPSPSHMSSDINMNEESNQLLIWMYKKLNVLGYEESLVSKLPSNIDEIIDFISNDSPKILLIYEDQRNLLLKCSLSELITALPSNIRGYFIRSSPEILSIHNINNSVQYGTVGSRGLTIKSLNLIMKGIVERQIVDNKELSWHYHRLMATLIDAAHASEGITVLYCPTFEYETVSKVAHDKDRLQIMESIVIHWTRQIKDLINIHENSTSSDSNGPIDEIEFWRIRTHNLLGIQDQLQSEPVRRITCVLEYVKSNYLVPFQSRTNEVIAKAIEARDNLKFLETIRKQCTDLRELEPNKVATILPDLLSRLRLIWIHSSYYSVNDNISNLLRMVSSEIISRFRAYIPIREIMDGDIEFCILRLNEAIHCVKQWKHYYYSTVEATRRTKEKYNNRVWDIDDTVIFAQIDAFVQRCHDLLEICESQIQFCRKSKATKGNPGPLPLFGSTKAQEIIDGIVGIQKSFQDRINRLRSLDYDILDVRISKWHTDYHIFKNGVKDLEVMFTNVINAAFDNNTSVRDCVILVETFDMLAKRDLIRRCIDKKAFDVMQMFMAQTQRMRREFEEHRLSPPLRRLEPQYSGSAIWANSLSMLIKEGYDCLQKITTHLSSRDIDELNEIYSTFVAAIDSFKKLRYTQWIEDVQLKANDNGFQRRLEKTLLRKAHSTNLPISQNDLNSNTEELASTLNTSIKIDVDMALYPHKSNPNDLVCNFDEDILLLFAEVNYWEKFHDEEFTVPDIVHDVINKRDNLRIMQLHVMNLVRAYNQILHDINPEERRLFIDHINRLDRKIKPGISKITWHSKNLIDIFVRDSCLLCEEVHGVVKDFKESKNSISKICDEISNTILLKVDKNHGYKSKSFNDTQNEYRNMLIEKFNSQYQTIITNLKRSFKCFREGGSEVQREWRSQINQIDKLIETSLKQSVKRSLQELSKAINGDAKTDPITLFTVSLQLETSNVVSYLPSMSELSSTLSILVKDVISTITPFQRLRGQNFDEVHEPNNFMSPVSRGASIFVSPKATTSTHFNISQAATISLQSPQATNTQTFYEILQADTDILRLVKQILDGMSSTSTELQKYVSYWDKHKSLWELDKENYIRKYAKISRSCEQYDHDVMRFRNHQSDVYSETSTHVINFVMIDCSHLKEKLISYCLMLQNRLLGLLNQQGLNDLNEIYRLLQESKDKLQVTPKNLHQLAAKISFTKDLKDKFYELVAKFPILHEIYSTLQKFEFLVKEEEVNMLNSLDSVAEEFHEVIDSSEKLLEKSKVIMKKELELQFDAFGNSVMELKSQALIDLPFSNLVDELPLKPQVALKKIHVFRDKVQQIQQSEEKLQSGLLIFTNSSSTANTYVNNKDLLIVIKDVELLEIVWTATQEWNEYWDTWKTQEFNSVNIQDLETIAGTYHKKVSKLGRDIKKWKVWENLKSIIDKFKETLPLIQDLRNDAMRPRHWKVLQDKIGIDFDPYDSSFTLNEIMKLKLNQYPDLISELSSNANKELAIENSLNSLEERWSSISLEMGSYKEKYFKLKSTDDITQCLEDDSVALSTMKASKFYISFKSRIDMWESCLSIIAEVIDSVLSVQRKWIYLESIFMSGGDISKQLPSEYTLFASINNDFFKVMSAFSANPIARNCCLVDGLLEQISSMDERLEKIQKSLDSYLETKRMMFPRFYFVSDDDLLEILGQSKDPLAVQKHIKKCFEGIKSLKLTPVVSNTLTNQTQKSFEATLMISHDGETAPFAEPIVIDGPVELWLLQVEKAMRRAMAKLLSISVVSFKTKKDKWMKETIGQLLITTGAIVWTADCNRSLVNIAAGTKNAMKQQKKKQIAYLNKLTALIRSQLSKIERNKVVSLITIEIHNRDVIERMVKANCSSVSDFEWLSQLRFIFSKDASEFGRCDVKQLNSILEWSGEYQGNNGRLVVTPLTDRCVLTLITAMYLNRGGNPLGPAGTGKTETVKDLGKNLAKYVVVINCSDGMDYKSVGRIFSGLVQSGSWGCFDEFNRIKIEVISVVAMQILSILNALSSKLSSFSFMGSMIPCNPTCGIFITMNPGYAGRTELPDNLKALMRPVAMMAPDLTMIAEVMLASEGFNEARTMAKKTVTLYSLMVQQLSKQDHYDYGLRNLKSVLNMAGQLKRSSIEGLSEEAILMRALRDMNLPKFIKDDERLFRLLLGDLFPSLELPSSDYSSLREAIEKELEKLHLQKHEFLIQKMFQFYDSRLTRHCNMLVGEPLGGKSTAWKVLSAAQTSLAKQNVEGFLPVTTYIISPKSIELDELYGAYDLATFEWKDGILSTIFKSCSEDEKQYEKVICFDGPIDAMWIESMNSVMDDNKILTLINGDRIPLTTTMSLIFETQDLRVASPATVSRAGMIYIDASELGWMTYVESWLKITFQVDEELQSHYRELFQKWVPKVLSFKALNCHEPIHLSDFHLVTTLCTLFNAICQFETSFNKATLGSDFFHVAEKLFVFAITWCLGGAVDENSRKKLSVYLSDIDATMVPVGNTIYDFFVEVAKNDFSPWDQKVPIWRSQKHFSFHDIIIPTVDTVRNAYLVENYMRVKKHTMLIGATGTGKSILGNMIAQDFELQGNSQLCINFSAATSSTSIQDIIEGSMEKRSKDKLAPQGGKSLIIFIDDFNMPKLTSRESPFQPPLELIRMFIDYNGWYDRVKCSWKYILDSHLLIAMGHPGGGRNQICQRTQSRFATINFTFPADSQIVRIFDSILSSKFIEYENDIKQLSTGIAIATLNVYKAVLQDFLITPEKFHYQFNMRDVAKVIQGLLMASRATIYSPETMLRLWIHECQRVFSDRFIMNFKTNTNNDSNKFREILAVKLHDVFQKDFHTLAADFIDPKIGPLFCGFIQTNVDGSSIDAIYEEVVDYRKVRSIVEEKLEDYNMEPKLLSMNLALFKDAVMHVCRIHRVLIQPRGNLMLIGIGGSGRSSLTRLAAYIANNMTIFTIEITKMYRLVEFREDLKKLYTISGCENKPVVFLFNDTQVKEESFLEDINNILSSGVVPNLFGKDELVVIYDNIRKDMLNEGLEDIPSNLWKFFVNRARKNIHVVLAMSPIGEALRSRCRMYPGFVNCTTIDYFHTWPAEALQEVAMKYLSTVEFTDESYRPKISSIFAEMHLSVINTSNRMLLELNRFNYVTPTNYIELVKGYKSLLEEKRTEIGNAANKLASGLAKLEDAKSQVEVLSKELEIKKIHVAKSQKDCEDLLVKIVSERRVADEQRRIVEADAERISQEAEECQSISNDAEAELAVALPALEKAMEEVDKLDKSAVSEVKAYTKPPALVATVLEAVMILFNKAIDWTTAKQVLSQSNFIQQIKGFDKDNILPSTTNKIKKYVDNPIFKPEEVKKVSGAAAALCIWVHAIYMYANVAREVAPKRQRLKEAMESLALKQQSLKESQEALAIVIDKLNVLQVSYDKSVNEKNNLREEAENLEMKLDRADKLVKGLAGEYVRWQASIGDYHKSLTKVTGDSLIAAAFLSYAGPFESRYRQMLVQIWINCVVSQKIAVTERFDFASFLSKPTDVRDWNIQGLPKDTFSTENGVIATRSSRWPLCIDPQGQANRWIRNMEGSSLVVIDLKTPNFLREVENAIQYGKAILLQDILEEVDPALEPVLSKSIRKVGNREVIRLGDKELDYSRDFRLYLTTKLANPHYTPEISTKTTVCNFAVTKDGLEGQLLGIVVQKEEPSLEKQKSELTLRVAKGKRQLVDLEDAILRLLTESKGSLLDDEGLVNTLQQSKVTSEEVTEQLMIAEETEKKIDVARSSYKASAVRAALAYFVLDDMSRVDPMYQFSLDAYVDLFNLSIDSSRKASQSNASDIGKRCEEINSFHTLSVYKYTCRGLFESDKLLFSLRLCFKIMESHGNVLEEEYNFFTIGSISGANDRTLQKPNPCPDWLPNVAWDSICDLDKLQGLQGIISGFEHTSKDWKKWYMCNKPESEPMPGDWGVKTTELQKLCILRSLRMDRLLFGAARFISSNIGPSFVDPPSFDLKSVFETSNCKTPLVFILSPGVDPFSGITQLAHQVGQVVENCALGQGQAPIAVEMVERGIKKGNWVFLANCHLMLSWMPTLEKLIETLIIQSEPHPKFRLWLSSTPDPNFPILILQRSIKMTTEPPKGLRANCLTLYNTISTEQFQRCQTQPIVYKKFLFALVWFHAILLERRKFKSLGFNIPYDFNESDFAICHDLIIAFLDEYPDRIPYDAMKYLIAEANYGGRVTDDWDRRLVNVYISELICEDCISQDKFMLSSLDDYFVPVEGDLSHYKEFIRGFPPNDHPLAFGQHSNSDMAASIEDANSLVGILVSLQPLVLKVSDDESFDPLSQQCSELLELTPELFDIRLVHDRVDSRSDPDPLKTVLFQEIDRYNSLLALVRSSLNTIIKVKNGTASVTAEIEEIMTALQQLRVPRIWGSTYPSLKPLNSWMRDLCLRVESFTSWIEDGIPKTWWLSAMTYPTGFLTAVLQVSARMNGVSIDSLIYETTALTHGNRAAITSVPLEGVYIYGLFVEGATWNFDAGFLEESRPMELISTMPIVYFKPIEGKKRALRGCYTCPLYIYPIRSGSRERPSYVSSLELKSGKFSSEFWTKRGVALLLSTSM